MADYYLGLAPSQRREGWLLEARFDVLRERALGLEGADPRDPEDPAAWARVTSELRTLLDEASLAVDVTAAARTSALISRLLVRELERAAAADHVPATAQEAARRAADACRWFTLAGLRTPRLEPLWVQARLSLAEGDDLGAERRFRELAALAADVGRPRWRERALLGLVGLARESGAAFAARAALEELATFRQPAHCWTLTRELAAQRLSEDRPARALELLESFPPSGLDPEVDLGVAAAEWRALQAAALVRVGALDRAASTLDDARRVPVRNGELLRLTEAALLLDRGEPAAALELLDPPASTDAEPDLEAIETLALRGRALLDLGRPEAAALPLQRAFDVARARDAARWRSAAEGLRDRSTVGEWLGLSAVELLARARAASGAPLLAAATIEAAHASCSVEVAAERLRELAASQDLGAVTWVVGADRSLAVHVRPDGTAEAQEIHRGRAALARAARRAREAVLATRVTPDAHPAALLHELSGVLLPASLDRALTRWRGDRGEGAAPSLALLPHGVLEGLPLELLEAGTPAWTLGYDTALTVVHRLRDPADLPAPIDGRTACWVALGAPADTAAPDLPGARLELRDLDRLDPRLHAVTGRAFDEARLLEALGGDAPVHVATHVLRLDDRAAIAPLGLLASSDGIVTAEQVAASAPRLPLLVLATCDSAAGRAVDGLSVRGLAQAALDGGTRAAVVSGWSLSDRRGRVASIAFHAGLRGGAAPAEALRRARCALLAAGAPAADAGALRLLGHP